MTKVEKLIRWVQINENRAKFGWEPLPQPEGLPEYGPGILSLVKRFLQGLNPTIREDEKGEFLNCLYDLGYVRLHLHENVKFIGREALDFRVLEGEEGLLVQYTFKPNQEIEFSFVLGSNI